MAVLVGTVIAAITGFAVLTGTGLVSANTGVNPRPDSAAAQGATTGLPYRLPDGFQSKYAQVSDFRMHYLRGGSGSPVVLLHGFPQTSAEMGAAAQGTRQGPHRDRGRPARDR
jgi:hypothetical protein